LVRRCKKKRGGKWEEASGGEKEAGPSSVSPSTRRESFEEAAPVCHHGEREAEPGPRCREPLPCRRVPPALSRRRLQHRPTVSDAVSPPPPNAEPCCLCCVKRTPALLGSTVASCPEPELSAVLDMSGLRAVFACRFASSPPRREPPCTPARKARTFGCQLYAEDHPAMRRRAVCRAPHRASRFCGPAFASW
jgi:hypothetical protein